jgi:hypothetical protein
MAQHWTHGMWGNDSSAPFDFLFWLWLNEAIFVKGKATFEPNAIPPPASSVVMSATAKAVQGDESPRNR